MNLILAIFTFFFSLSSFAVSYESSIIAKFNNKNVNYILHKPDLNLDKYPLLIFLHGVGEKAQFELPRHRDDIAKLKKHGPSKLIDNSICGIKIYPLSSFQFNVLKVVNFTNPKLLKRS